MAEAPVALVFCADTSRAGDKYGDRGANLYALQDATIAAAYAQLAIVAAGMASAWVGYFDEKLLGDFLELSTGERPIAILSVGYAAELPESTPRRRLDEVVSFK